MQPALPKSIPHAVAVAAGRAPDSVAVVDGDRRVSYRELHALMLSAASSFVRAGIEPGDRVAIWVPNSLDWIVACTGAQAAGAVVVPINTRFKTAEASFVLNRSRARALVVVDRFIDVSYPDLLRGIDLPHLERMIRVGRAEADCTEWTEFLADGQRDEGSVQVAEQRFASLDGTGPSDILFTSGTTGEPKGVVTNHRQNLQVYEQWSNVTGLRADDRYAIVFPFFHSAGYKAGCVSCLIRGATMYPQSVFEPSRLMDLVASEKITVLPGPPTLFQTLLASPRAGDGSFASLRIAVTGASTVAPSMIEAMRRELGIRTVIAGYGLTETCGTVTMTREHDSAEIVVNSCGRAIPGVELRCVDDAGHDVPAGAPGEVIVRGMNVMLGYLDDPAATAEVIDRDGWFRTGDIGTLDQAGYLRITDRKKEMFIVGGFNCYPAEIEKTMLRHPALAQVAVIGVPDERLGEVAKAFVILRPGQVLTEQELIAWCRDQMANYKVPRFVRFVESLPLNATGKVQKFLLSQASQGAR
jgi:HIP---CoA ligase